MTIVKEVYFWLVVITGGVTWLWILGIVLDKCLTRWLHFIGAWPAVIEALKKQAKAPKRSVMK
jgi:hypothetical protein